jgi:thiamine biosynthesis lipoprotein
LSVGVNIPSSEELLPRYLFLQNTAVATSGDMYQYVEIDGKHYSHIVNPKTGLGLTHQRNVTVIAPDGATADWLATACSVLSIKKAIKLCDSFPNTGLLIAEKKGKVILKWQNSYFEKMME